MENIMNPNEEKKFTLSDLVLVAETKAAYDLAYAVYLERENYDESAGEEALKQINKYGDQLEALLGKEDAAELLESTCIWEIDEDGLPIHLPKPVQK